MEEISLDFLQSLPMQNHYDERTNSSNLFNDIDANFRKKQSESKRCKMAQNIAKVDQLVQEIDKLKSLNMELQQQLKGFQVSAQQVQELYTTEKEAHFIAKCNLEQLQKTYHKVDVDLTNIALVNDQLKARLADYDKLPVNFDNLAIKYVKIMSKLDGYDILKHCPDKDLIEKLREYCISKKLKIPACNSPKKSRSKGSRVKNVEAAVQCNILEESFKSKPKVKDQNTQCSTIKRDQASQCNNTMTSPQTQCSTIKRDQASQCNNTTTSPHISLMENSLKNNVCQNCKTKFKVLDQSTQCCKTTCDQGTQYISTMITRTTNTDKILKKHVQTMFPEPPAIDDILKVYSRWSNIRSISPILSPSRLCRNPPEDMIRAYSTTGTCTMLCNIRRRIDYLPLNNTSNIKQEYFTPSASPTPTCYPITSRSRLDSFSSNVPCNISPSLLNLLNSNTNSSLENLSSNAFNELWQIFGKMLLSLLQSNNTTTANITRNIPLNQQQFLDWLRELYMATIDQNIPIAQTQMDPSVATSPLFFNDVSTLAENVLRPQPQKTLTEENLARTNISENVINFSSDNTSNSQILFGEPPNDSNYINGALQQIHNTSNTNELQAIKCESKLHKLHKSITEEQTKFTTKSKTKHEILEKIQELVPTTNLNKEERKLLKKLLKNNSHRKKALKPRKSKGYNKQSSVVILKKDDYNDDTVETAVDFLKNLAVVQQNSQPMEDNISEKEKIFLQQISHENMVEDVPNIQSSDEFTFIKPSNSLIHTHSPLNTNIETSERRISNASQKIENKYQLLFGESDSECEDQEMLTKNPIFNLKPVIKSSANLETGSNIINYEECTKLDSCSRACNITECTSCTIVNMSNLDCSQDCTSLTDAKSADCDEQCSDEVKNNFTNISQDTSLSASATPILDSLNNLISPQNILIPDTATPVLKNLEYNDKQSQYIHPSNEESSNYSSDLQYSSSNNFEPSNAAEVIVVQLDKGKLESLETRGKLVNPVYNLNVIDSSNEHMMIHKRIITTSPLVQNDEYMPEKSIECMKNISGYDFPNDSMNLHKAVITSEPTYSDDFENDFVISSDESVIIENESNAIHKLNSTIPDNQFCCANFNSICSNISQNSSSESPQINMQSFESNQQQNEMYSSNASSNIFEYTNTIHEKDSRVLIEPEVESCIAYPEKYCLENTTKSQKRPEDENINTILNCEPQEHKYLQIYNAEDILESTLKDAGPKNYTEEINSIKNSELTQRNDTTFNICRSKVSQSSSLINFKNKGKFMSNSKLPNDSFYQTFQRFVNNQHLERGNTAPLRNFVGKNYLKKQNQNIVGNVLNSSNSKLKHSYFTESESKNCSNNVKNSAPCPITVVSASSSNDKVTETSNSKNNNENVPKCSTLSALKLLDINNIHNHQNNSYNSFINTQTVKEIVGTQDGLNENQFLKDQNTKNSSNDDEMVKMKSSENINSIKTFEYPNTSQGSRRERVVILSCSTITTSAHTNRSENNINSSICHQKLNIENRNSSIYGLNMIHQNHLNDQGKDCKQVKQEEAETLNFSNTKSDPNNISNLNVACEIDASDNSSSLEDKLMIDERSNSDALKPSTTEQHLNNSISTEDLNDSTNSSNISSKSTPNDEVITLVNLTVNDVLKDELETTSITSEVISKRGRKRKNDCLAELQPSKRSQRLKDKQMVSEQSLNLSKTPIELGKYTNSTNNLLNNVLLKCPLKEEMKKKCFQSEIETVKNNELIENENRLQLGFFKERLIEEDMTSENTKIFNVAKHQEPNASDIETCRMSSETKDCYKQEQEEREKYNIEAITISSEPENVYQQAPIPLETEKYRNLQELEICHSQKDCIITDSPQSPQPTQSSNNEELSESFVTIPLERPLHFMPQANIPTLFDVLISSYKTENNKRFLESVSTKEAKRNEYILDTFLHEIKLYCYNKMELDLYCTSTSLINKLLSVSPNYNLIQEALITVTQNAEGSNVLENDLPSTIQEMPPRHLSKCLQRLFAFLKNINTRDQRFCQDLTNNIEAILFKSTKLEYISLQATLNLTQLYLMATNVQEHLEISKHTARLFIAKCFYFYLQNSVHMIHEVLMWYPTVLPHREDKTYDRSDALISVVQHLLMSTKYDMCNTELRGKSLLSKLRYEYHFEPYKPAADEIINVLVEKLKCSKFHNITLAFALLCKRLSVENTKELVLNQHLIPLANEYYCLALKTNEYDKRIAVLLEIISILIRPLPITIDVQKYFNEFARFLNGFERQIIQEAAVCCLLRLQRFNVKYCYNLLRHFRPAYNLNTQTQVMLKSFIYRRPLKFWKNLNSQNYKDFN